MRKFSRIVTVFVLMSLVAALLLGGCASPAPSPTTSAPSSSQPVVSKAATSSTSKETIKIGLVSSFSGFFAPVVPYWLPAVQLAINEANAAGGVMGSQVELLTKDDQGDPSNAVQRANELKAAGVAVIIGSLMQSSNEALFKWAQDAKMPVMLPTTPHNSLRTTEFGKYGFFPTPPSHAWAAAAAKWVADNNIKSVYIMGGDATITHEFHDSFWPIINKIKPGAVLDAGFTLRDQTNQDWQADLSTVVARKPDLLILISGGPPLVSFVQQAQQVNLLGQTKLLGWGLSGNNAAPFGKNFPEGFLAEIDCPFYLDTPEMKAFTQAYLALSGVYPDELSLPDYIGTKAFLQAMNQAKSADPDAIVAAVEKLSVDTPVGPLTFNDYSHQPEMPIWIATSAISKDWPIAIGTNLIKYKDGIYMTKDEVLAARKGK